MTLSAPNSVRNGMYVSVLSIRQLPSRLREANNGRRANRISVCFRQRRRMQASLQAEGSRALSPSIFTTRGMESSHPTPDARAVFELRAAPLAQISTRKQLRTHANLVSSVKLLEASANLVLEWGASSVGWPPQAACNSRCRWVSMYIYPASCPSFLALIACSSIALFGFRYRNTIISFF